MQRHISGVRTRCLHTGKLLHRRFGAIGFERGLAPHPVGTLLGDGALGQPIAQLNFELASIEAALAANFRNVKLPALLANLVGNLVRNECRRGEDELQLIDLFEFRFQRLEGIH